ncbi:MAG: hypothetical protein PVJ61_07810 [Dehalococcoidia bacterium]|jgi:hypothetical protein
MKKLIVGLLMLVPVLVLAGCSKTYEVYFPVQKSDNLDQMEALLQGTLELDDDGWLRVESGGDSHVIIWPYGFEIKGGEKEIKIHNGAGQAVAVVGETIQLSGGSVTQEVAETYTGQGIPDGLGGSFWIASEVVSQ